MKKIALYIMLFTSLLSCTKLENRLEGSWFVNYFENDLKTKDFTLVLEEGGTGEIDGSTKIKWSVAKKELSITTGEYIQIWENNRNYKNTQFYLSSDTLGNYVRMEMERIK